MQVHEYQQRADLWELRHCRLYVPVDGVSFHGINVDDRALEQLACFRRLESLSFDKCRMKADADIRPAGQARLCYLELYRTPITDSQLQSISRLGQLDCLILDATGLKGDWLRPLCGLRNSPHSQ